MATRLLSDELWNEIEPFFPTYEFSPKGGRPPAGNRTVFTCILFVLKRALPGKTCRWSWAAPTRPAPGGSGNGASWESSATFIGISSRS